MSVRRTVERKPISVHGSFTVQDCQLLRKHSNVPILLQALSPLFSSYFPYVPQHLLQAPKARKHLRRGFFTNPRYARDVVGLVALQADEVSNKPGWHPQPLLLSLIHISEPTR